jgi:hypothetical protein
MGVSNCDRYPRARNEDWVGVAGWKDFGVCRFLSSRKFFLVFGFWPFVLGVFPAGEGQQGEE